MYGDTEIFSKTVGDEKEAFALFSVLDGLFHKMCNGMSVVKGKRYPQMGFFIFDYLGKVDEGDLSKILEKPK
jgi:hypothetical protein